MTTSDQSQRSTEPTPPCSLRGPTPRDVEYFRSVLSRPDRSVLTTLSHSGPISQDGELLARYNKDWTDHYRGSSALVLRPRSTSEVSSVLKYCHDNFIGVVPQGGNTGLCGAATPVGSLQIVLSLEDMNAIHGIDEHSGILTCDTGCILEHLHEYAHERGALFPLDIGAKGTCQIGGNISTNAGGQYFNRFGGLHGTVMGLEVVLPDGRVLRLNLEVHDDGAVQRNGTHRKDNTGYDLKHLFIGAEGTLGVVTKVAVACPTLPASTNATMLVCDSYDKVLEVLQTAKEELGEILSATEVIDYNTLLLVKQAQQNDGVSRLVQDMLRANPSTSRSEPSRPLFLLVETQGSHFEHDAAKMDAFLSRLYERDAIANGFLARDTRQALDMWRVRESCNESVARAGCVYKYDVSVPIADYMAVAREVERELADPAPPAGLTVCVWGHVADGNAHINVVALGRRGKDAAMAARIETAVYGAVRRRHGSISAEHGLGQAKNEHVGSMKEPSVLDVMASVKALFDPHGIMNPGKYLPEAIRK